MNEKAQICNDGKKAAEKLVSLLEGNANTRIRMFAIEHAMRVILPGSQPNEVIAMAQEIEQFVLGHSDESSMKEPENA